MDIQRTPYLHLERIPGMPGTERRHDSTCNNLRRGPIWMGILPGLTLIYLCLSSAWKFLTELFGLQNRVETATHQPIQTGRDTILDIDAAEDWDRDFRHVTFCFQAWHISNHPTSESAVSNRKMAEFMQRNLSEEPARRWSITACPPLKPRASLATPVSIRVRRNVHQWPQAGTEEDAGAVAFHFAQFRDYVYPTLATVYFHGNLGRRLDFHNVFAITSSGRRVEELERVPVNGGTAIDSTSKARLFLGIDSPPKARLFLDRRYSDEWSAASTSIVTDVDPVDVNFDEDEDTSTWVEDEGGKDEVDWEHFGKIEFDKSYKEHNERHVLESPPTGSATNIKDFLARLNPSFPFNIAWYILRPYILPCKLESRLLALSQHANAIMSDRHPHATQVLLEKAHSVFSSRKHSRSARPSYNKLLKSIKAPQRAIFRSWALEAARWILQQVGRVLRRVGEIM